MIPIAVESMVMQLPPVDLAIVIAAGAIAVSVYTFYISHTHIGREQIKTSRYLWERVNEKYDPITEIGRSRVWVGIIDVPWVMLRSVVGEIDYFAYLILVDELQDGPGSSSMFQLGYS